jgi:hypothetical protein
MIASTVALVALIGENSVNPANSMVSQKITTARSAGGRPASASSNNNTRASVIADVVARARNLRFR